MKELLKEWKYFNRHLEVKQQVELVENFSYVLEKDYFDNLTISYLNESLKEDVESEEIKAQGFLSKISANKKLRGVIGTAMLLVITKLGVDKLEDMQTKSNNSRKASIESLVKDMSSTSSELSPDIKKFLNDEGENITGAIEQQADRIIKHGEYLRSIDTSVLEFILDKKIKKVKKRKRKRKSLNKSRGKTYTVSALGSMVTGSGRKDSSVSGVVNGTSDLVDPSEEELTEMSKRLSKDISADIDLNNTETGKKVIESVSIQTMISVQTYKINAYRKIKESARHFYDIAKDFKSAGEISEDDLNVRLNKFIDRHSVGSFEVRQVSQLTALLVTCSAHTEMCKQTIEAINQGGKVKSTIEMGSGRHTKSVDGEYSKKTASRMKSFVEATNRAIRRFDNLNNKISSNYLIIKNMEESRDKLPESVKKIVEGSLMRLINEDGSYNKALAKSITGSLTKLGITTDADDSVEISGIVDSGTKSRRKQSR